MLYLQTKREYFENIIQIYIAFIYRHIHFYFFCRRIYLVDAIFMVLS